MIAHALDDVGYDGSVGMKAFAKQDEESALAALGAALAI